MSLYIFVDESGQFSNSDVGAYFLAASFTVGDQRRTQKKFMSLRTKFPRKMRGQTEIKWSASSITPDLRLRILRKIADMDVRIRYIYFEKKNIPADQVSKTGLLYINVIGEMLEMYLPPVDNCVRIICDQRKLKGQTPMEFKNQLRARLLPKVTPGTTIEIEMVDSTTNSNVQIADWIVGALAYYHEKKYLGEEFYAILKNNILEGKELFKKMRFVE